MFNSDFFDADYYERGRSSGKGGYENYRWMPMRSTREALAVVDCMGLDDNSRVLDVGCAKGFLVHALRHLGIRADGCDVSKYAIQDSLVDSWDCSRDSAWAEHAGQYTHAVAKDVLEHLDSDGAGRLLRLIRNVAHTFLCVVPLGDRGVYRIPSYHIEGSHVLAEDERFWDGLFTSSGWQILMRTHHVRGIKDNWAHYHTGNYVVTMRRV